jgi:hypothetical protein
MYKVQVPEDFRLSAALKPPREIECSTAARALSLVKYLGRDDLTIVDASGKACKPEPERTPMVFSTFPDDELEAMAANPARDGSRMSQELNTALGRELHSRWVWLNTYKYVRTW